LEKDHQGGKIVIPAHAREEMGVLVEIQSVVERLPEGELRMRSFSAAIKKTQAIVARSIGRDRSLANE